MIRKNVMTTSYPAVKLLQVFLIKEQEKGYLSLLATVLKPVDVPKVFKILI